MDRVKLILQLQHGGAIELERQYKGIVDCFKRLCAEQGVRSLWRGNMASVARCFPSQALNIAFRDYYRMIFLANVDRKRNFGKFAVGNILAGGAGGATTLCFVYPLDFARTRLAVDGASSRNSHRFRGMNHCFQEIYAREGLIGLYRGFFASLQFVVASRAVFFGIFDTVRCQWSREGELDQEQLSFVMHWCLAQFSIIISSIACYPLDTVRRRLMMQSGKRVKPYKNSLDCFQKIIKSDGVNTLYKGALSNSLKCTSGALVLAIYYEVLKYM